MRFPLLKCERREIKFQRSRALTLVELVLATALAAMLMAALLGIMTTVSNMAAAVESESDTDWHAQFLELLFRDLIVADTAWVEGRSLMLGGRFESYTDEMKIVHTVAYGVTSVDSSLSLVSRREDRGALGYFATNAHRVVIERLDSDGFPQPLPSEPGPVPDRVRVWMWGELESFPVLVRDLVIR